MTDVEVRFEPAVYRPDGEHSYFSDLAVASDPTHLRAADAATRLLRHAAQVRAEAATDTPTGRRYRASLLDTVRSADTGGTRTAAAELRAASTAAGSAGAFVPPDYLVGLTATYRTYGRAFVDQATVLPLPEAGMTVLVPQITSPAGTAVQPSEGTSVTEIDPAATLLTGPVQTAAGQVTASQQLVDRQQDASADLAISAQLEMAYNTALDAAAIAAALAAGGPAVVDNGSLSIANTWTDVAKAQAQMLTAAGTVLPATHTFFPILEWAWLAAQLDNAGRPIIEPSWSAPTVAPEGADAEGDCGYRMVGTKAFRDGNLPTAAGARTVTDGVTNSTTTVTSNTANFGSGDVGKTITGAGIPASTTIASVTNPTTAVLSAAATASATGVTFTIGAGSSNGQLVVANMPSVLVFEGAPMVRAFPETQAGSLQVVLQRWSYWALVLRHSTAVVAVTGSAYPVNPTV